MPHPRATGRNKCYTINKNIRVAKCSGYTVIRNDSLIFSISLTVQMVNDRHGDQQPQENHKKMKKMTDNRVGTKWEWPD